MLGTSLARRLETAGHRPTIIERGHAIGGLAAPAAIGQFTWDSFYHVILQSDLELRSLLGELGLTDRLRWGTTRTGFFADGRLWSLSSSLDFLRFPPLSLAEKARLGATILYVSRVRDWRRLESIPVAAWLERLSGRRVFERIWLPLLRSKLGDNYRLASAVFIWTIVARLYGARRSGMKREVFGYVEGGYRVVLDHLGRALQRQGIEVVGGAQVEAIREVEAGVEVRLAGGATRSFDAAVLTVPCSQVADLCPQLGEAERARLRGVRYQSIVCLSMLLRRPLAGYYVTNIVDGGVPFTGVIEMTALVDREQFGGHSLVYLPRYTTDDESCSDWSDAEVESRFLPALERMYPGFARIDVIEFRVARARDVLAVPTLHYSTERLPAVATSLRRVFVVNSAQIVAGTLNVNETLGAARSGAERVAALLEGLGRAGAEATDG